MTGHIPNTSCEVDLGYFMECQALNILILPIVETRNLRIASETNLGFIGKDSEVESVTTLLTETKYSLISLDGK